MEENRDKCGFFVVVAVLLVQNEKSTAVRSSQVSVAGFVLFFGVFFLNKDVQEVL